MQIASNYVTKSNNNLRKRSCDPLTQIIGTMKRSVDSSCSLKPLKRTNSSLFSIATLVDDENNIESLLNGGLNNEHSANGKARTVSSASDLSPLLNGGGDGPPEEALSSCSSESELSPDFVNKEVGLCQEGYKNVAETTSVADTWDTAEELQGDLRTGLVFESASKHFDRFNKFHKERPMRVTCVYDYLSNLKPEENGGQSILERCQVLGKSERENRDLSSEELFLEDDNYLMVHLPGYMQRLDKISKCNCHTRLDVEAEQFKSIYFTDDSVREAKTTASSFCKLVSEVISDKLDNGFAVIRPPGHHAEPGLAGGYCVINNVAVAAAYAREKMGVQKILIVDWDVHHGNGTQKCFIDNPNIMYFSVHRYHGGNFFPFLQQGGPSSVGIGTGKGFNMNVGWNDKKMGDDEYLVVWEKLLMPTATEFNPDLVLVSAGFDAASGDMGECDVTPECFGRLTRRLKTLAKGKVVCALEGGYVRSVLCKCIENVLSSLLDAKSSEKSKEELERFFKNVGKMEMLDLIEPSAAKSIRETMKAHSEFWNCLSCTK